jgi:hypothetical protein
VVAIETIWGEDGLTAAARLPSVDERFVEPKKVWFTPSLVQLAPFMDSLVVVKPPHSNAEFPCVNVTVALAAKITSTTTPTTKRKTIIPSVVFIALERSPGEDLSLQQQKIGLRRQQRKQAHPPRTIHRRSVTSAAIMDAPARITRGISLLL